MKSCQIYLGKQKQVALLPPLTYAFVTVVIPCYNESNVIATLKSIWNCKAYPKELLVILVLNHEEGDSQEAILQNEKTLHQLYSFQKENETSLRRLAIIYKEFQRGKGGVGKARKVGMDEAVRQYARYGKDGIIVSLDADTLCLPNYLCEIDQCFHKHPWVNTLVIRYAHQLEKLSSKHKQAIIQYEIYLRYMTLAYRYLNHPHAFHTIGSAFAVRASAYCKQGGMNSRQAGEDFYFLQKMFALGNCRELNTSCIFPSSRLSDRVPFGTGRAVYELLESQSELHVYSFKAFLELKIFFDRHLDFYKVSSNLYEKILYNDLGGLIKSWLIQEDFFSELEKINNNCASEKMFHKKFFENFSILKVIKYLNFSHSHFLKKVGVFHAVACLPISKHFDFQTPEHLLCSLRAHMAAQTFVKD